jgi:Flp pilus assembly secretin CpaC
MTRLAVEDPTIVDVVADPAGEQLRLMAMSPGVTTVIVWTKEKTRRAFLVTVKEREMLPAPPGK